MEQREIEGEFNRLREVIRAGFILIATELELNRNANKANNTVDHALDKATQLMDTLQETWTPHST